ncbi:MAG: hypothetical protein OEM38_10790 [Gammaproteobacteria bacterium]|nr:hypothetical protein [Gammaproteobacteria bacterium]
MKTKKLFYVLINSFFLTACFHSNDAKNVSPNQAFLTAFNQMENVSNRGVDLVEQQTSKSAAFNSINNSALLSGNASINVGTSIYKPGLVTTPSPALSRILNISHVFTTAINTYIPTQKSSAQQKISSSLFSDIESESISISQSDIDQFLNELFNPPIRVGNTVTYTFKTNEMCDNNTDCIAVLSKFKMQLTIVSSEEGEISFIFDDIPLMSIDYADNMLALEIFLQGIKQIETVSNSISSTASLFTLPTTFTGSFKLSATLSTATSVQFTASIPEAIDIDGILIDELITFSIASTSNIFTIKADSETEIASLEFGLGAFFARFNSSSLYNPSSYEISLAALTGLFTLDNATGDNIVATNVGIGNQPFTMNIDGINAMKLEMDTIDFNIDGAGQALTLDTELNINFEVLNVNGELGLDVFDLANNPTDNTLTGTLTVTAPENTELLDIESTGTGVSTDITKVETGGPLHILGTGYYLSDIIVNAGQCLNSLGDTAVFGDGTSVTNCN